MINLNTETQRHREFQKKPEKDEKIVYEKIETK